MLWQVLLRRAPAAALARRPFQRRLSVTNCSAGRGGGPAQFERLVAALPGYIEEHGHGWVTPAYVRATNSYTMGRDAERARKLARKDKLGGADEDALVDEGLAWELNEPRWDRVRRALATFGELHSKIEWLLVSQSFVVPSEAPWHKICWGMQLGETVRNIRAREDFVKDRSERREWLDGIGFVWDEHEHRWREQVQPALLAYREVHGDTRVPVSFVVPSEAPWPEACWGMKLGKTVSDIRGKETLVKGRPERLDWLDSIGFVWRA
jgi:hypothetical protein